MIIGGYIVQESDTPGKIWISNGDGEGGEFCERAFMAALENGAGGPPENLPAVVDTFFWENF